MIKKCKEKINSKWEEFTTNRVYISIFVLIVTIIIFIIITIFSGNDNKEFINGIHVELFGIVFDAVVLVLLFNLINSLGEKKQRIKHYKDEIDDFRQWSWFSEEARFKIRGNIKRLNRDNISNLNLSDINICTVNEEGYQRIEFRYANLENSRLVRSDLSYLDMTGSTLNETECLSTKFIDTQLMHGKFRNCHLQQVKFTNAYLHGADFTGSTLSGKTSFANTDICNAIFDNLTIGPDIEFEGAEVTADFFSRVRNWTIFGENVFLSYQLCKVPVEGGHFRYILTKQ